MHESRALVYVEEPRNTQVLPFAYSQRIENDHMPTGGRRTHNTTAGVTAAKYGIESPDLSLKPSTWPEKMTKHQIKMYNSHHGLSTLGIPQILL